MIPPLLKLGRVWLAVLGVAGYQLLIALLATLPLREALAASRIVRLPAAETELFAPGGLFLVEWLRLDGVQIVAAGRASLELGLLLGVTQLLPLAALFLALAQGEKLSYARDLGRALALLPPLTLLWGVTLLVRALALVLLALCTSALSAAIETRHELWLVLASTLLGLGIWSVPGIVQDLARALVVGHGKRALAAALSALVFLGKRPLRVTASYLGWLGPGALLGFSSLALFYTNLAWLAAHGLWWLGVLLVELALLGMAWFRAAWFHAALELGASFCAPAPGDTHANSAAPDGPSQSLGA